MGTVELQNEFGKHQYEQWHNVQPDCELCEMDRRTEWYIETPRFVVAEKLGGGPFIVSKRHQMELDKHEEEAAHRLVSLLYDDYELRVLMSIVEEHWHAHIVTSDDPDLSGE